MYFIYDGVLSHLYWPLLLWIAALWIPPTCVIGLHYAHMTHITMSICVPTTWHTGPIADAGAPIKRFLLVSFISKGNLTVWCNDCSIEWRESDRWREPEGYRQREGERDGWIGFIRLRCVGGGSRLKRAIVCPLAKSPIAITAAFVGVQYVFRPYICPSLCAQ